MTVSDPVQPLEPTEPMQIPMPGLKGTRSKDILLLVFSSVAFLGLLIRGGYLLVAGAIDLISGNSSTLSIDMLGAVSMLFATGLLLPIVAYTLKRLKGKEILPAAIRPVKFWQISAMAGTWVVVVILAAVLSSLFPFGWAVALPLFLLGISLPIIGILWTGTGGLASGSRRRLWTAFGYGMAGGTAAALLLEYLLVGIVIVGIGVLAVTSPQVQTIFNQIKTEYMHANGGDLQTLLTALAPILANPVVIISILIFAAVLTPLIEEAVKPAIIWLVGKRLHSPAEGFVLGALCGAGFAMMEGLMSASNTPELWGFSLPGRAAASLMHITSSGILGWGIASAQLEKRYWRLAWTYLLSTGMHGLWNGSAILAVYGALRTTTMNNQLVLSNMVFILGGAGMLIVELGLILTALPLLNRFFRRSAGSIPAFVQSDIIPPPVKPDAKENHELDPKIR